MVVVPTMVGGCNASTPRWSESLTFVLLDKEPLLGTSKPFMNKRTRSTDI